jgi:hypothetical protein
MTNTRPRGLRIWYSTQSVSIDNWYHKGLIYIECHSVFVCRRNWDSPTPSPSSECMPPPPEPKGGGEQTPAGEGVGVSQLRRLEKAWHSAYSVVGTYFC